MSELDKPKTIEMIEAEKLSEMSDANKLIHAGFDHAETKAARRSMCKRTIELLNDATDAIEIDMTLTQTSTKELNIALRRIKYAIAHLYEGTL